MGMTELKGVHKGYRLAHTWSRCWMGKRLYIMDEKSLVRASRMGRKCVGFWVRMAAITSDSF